ncbi:DUF4883 family protein [Haloimpatiens sp. FM7315]|uniref:DUF4883 family protein n=1 Tax=Haloimpatiens sp. FM7315 TaxID=3298609 RepID=UPI0035A290D4
MKKIISLLICILIIVFLCLLNSCSPAKLSKEKPSNHYYFTKLANNITISKKVKLNILDTNFYKNKSIKEEDLSTIINFMNNLKVTNFIKKPFNLPQKPEYKIFLELEGEKYVINVYNEKYISIFPWDGNYSMDYIDMSSIYTAYNLHGFCKYLIYMK